MTWGRDTDEHEAREQLIAFVEAGGTLVDTAAGYTDGDSERLIGILLGDVVRPRRDRAGDQGRHRPSRRRAVHQRLPRPPAQLPRRLAATARRRPRRPVAGAHLGRRRPARGDARGARPRGHHRPGVVRRGEQLQRLAVPPRPRPGSAPCPGRAPLASNQVEYSLLNRAVEAEAVPGGAGPRARHPAVVAAGSRRAHRQVPRRHPGRLARRLPALLQPSSAATSTTRSQRVVEAVAKAADGPRLVARSRWRWPGCATGPGVTAPILGARTAAQLRESLGVEECELPPEIVQALDDVSDRLEVAR